MENSASSASPEPRAKSPDATTVHVAIVGAGPRGTSVLERLCASAPELLPADAQLTIHVIDPSSPGPGRVWRTAQSSELLTNTVASQVTLFTDDSVTCEGPIRPGPSLHECASERGSDVGPDEYSTRAEYGRYLEWFFGTVVRTAPRNVKIEVHADRAVKLDDAAGGSQTITLLSGRTLPDLAAVVLAQGHLPVLPDDVQKHHIAHAKLHGLRYIPPSNPADVDLSAISAGEPVLLRGLGLSFFDYMALLTVGRGGRFERAAQGQGLRYHASGREPRLYAGSQRGVPHHARGDNEKGASGRHDPLVFTEEVLNSLRERADGGHPLNFMTEVFPLVSKEVRAVYYGTLLRQRRHGQDSVAYLQDFHCRFLAAQNETCAEDEVLDGFRINADSRWSWDRITLPHYGETFASKIAWRKWLQEYLRRDAAHAARGNVQDPMKAALDVLRDLRNELRVIVDHRGLQGSSRQHHLDLGYTPLNAFLSIGPPRQRVEELVALMDAGVLEIVGPRMEVHASSDGDGDGGKAAWIASSPDVPGSEVRATTFIEARLPEPNLRHTADDLLIHLLGTGQCRPHVIDVYETGGLDVTPSPSRVIDNQGSPHPSRFAIGVPTEGVHWVTAAGARPGVNSIMLQETDAVARAALTAVNLELETSKPVEKATQGN